MAYRFTNTEKWSDSWFYSLSLIEKMLFIYLCENCDCAGFIEINYRRISADINVSQLDIQGAFKGLSRGLIYSKDNDSCYILNYLKHQKNLPLNPNNKAHLGILKRFELYSKKFDIQDVNEFIQGASKGLQSPIGIGIGIGIGNGLGKSDIFQIEIDELKTIVLSDQLQMESLCMVHKIQPIKATQLVNDFCLYLKSTGELKKDEKDFKRHLSNWIGTTLKKEKSTPPINNDFNPATKLL